MEETKFLCRNENLSEVFTLGMRDVSHESYWFPSEFICNLILIVVILDGDRYGLVKFYSIP